MLESVETPIALPDETLDFAVVELLTGKLVDEYGMKDQLWSISRGYHAGEPLAPSFFIDLKNISELQDTGFKEEENIFVLDKIGLRHAVALSLLVSLGFLTQDDTWVPKRSLYDHFSLRDFSHQTMPIVARCFSSFSDIKDDPYIDGFFVTHEGKRV